MKTLTSVNNRNSTRKLAVHVLSGAVALIFGVHATMAEQDVKPVHGIAMHGNPKYGPEFDYFDYVNPNAPKGGKLLQATRGTFDSFNTLIPKGNAVGTGSTESLLTSSFDEPFTEYGLIAESIEVPEDRSWVIFNLSLIHISEPTRPY